MNKSDIKKTIISAAFLSLGMVLPFFVGQIKEIGDTLLPMHIPVMLCGLVCGAKYGFAVGLILPLLRAVTVGMPPIYPNAVWMAVELATYGFVIGFLYFSYNGKQLWWIYCSLIISMICGRITWGITKAVLLGVSGKMFTFQAFIVGGIIDSIPGIILQLVLIPAIIKLKDVSWSKIIMKSRKKEINMVSDKIKGKLGFGCMRLPMIENEVDKDEFNRMIDIFIKSGFNYFDTAHGYLEGKSEKAIRDCISARYDREDFVLANKISYWCFEKEEDIVPLFEKQLELCGVEYFDFYLFHCLNREGYAKHKKCNTFEIVKKLKEQGKIKHIGMSFHDTADFLDLILTEQPFMEAVQLQLNYLDYDDPNVQSKACYDVAVKHGKKVIVMEPVKGGALADLPKEALEVLMELGDESQASYALRYAATYPEVFMVLSGMGNMEMMSDNIKTFKNFVPIAEKDLGTFDRVREIIRTVKQLPCTKCNYCAEVCPSDIPISEIFSIYNKLIGAKISRPEAKGLLAPKREKIADCVKCGKCEGNCPQGIKIREELEKIGKIANL